MKLLALLLCSCVPLGPTSAAVVDQAGRSRPDVFLILADDIAYDDLMPMLAAGRLPNIKRIVEQGTTFHSGYANAVCSPTRQSLQLGRWREGEMGLSCSNGSGKVPVEELTLAELHTAGPSGLFGKWHIGSNPAGPWPFLYIPFGYGRWFGTPVNLGGNPPLDPHCGGQGYRDWPRVDDGQVTLHVMDYQPIALRDAALAWLAATQGTPRFLDYRPALAHGPFHRPPASLLPPGYVVDATDRAKYEAMILALDETLGPILDHVDWANDLVFFIGDNGTPEQVTTAIGKSKTTCFERGIHVPFFAAGPGFKVGDSYALVHVADVYPTVAAFWGATPQPNDGISLFNTAGHDSIVCSGTDDLMARTGTVKLRRIISTGDEQLFDLALDPQETVSLLDDPSYDAIEAKLRVVLDQFQARDPQ